MKTFLEKTAITGRWAGKILERTAQRTKDYIDLGTYSPMHNAHHAGLPEAVNEKAQRIMGRFLDREGMAANKVFKNLKVTSRDLQDKIRTSEDTGDFLHSMGRAKQIFAEPAVAPRVLRRYLEGPTVEALRKTKQTSSGNRKASDFAINRMEQFKTRVKN